MCIFSQNTLLNFVTAKAPDFFMFILRSFSSEATFNLSTSPSYQTKKTEYINKFSVYIMTVTYTIILHSGKEFNCI